MESRDGIENADEADDGQDRRHHDESRLDDERPDVTTLLGAHRTRPLIDRPIAPSIRASSCGIIAKQA